MSLRVRLTHIDGKLPNLALMKLAHWHKAKGDTVTLAYSPEPRMDEGHYDLVYGSTIFRFPKSMRQVVRLREAFPDAIVGGTGTEDISRNVEGLIGQEYEHYDYSIYPKYEYSLGFTQRGCRLKCGFCVVPKKEGDPRSVNTIADIWRPGTPRCVCLLDNDFFGEAHWPERLAELNDGNFKVCFNQGINARLITTDAIAAAIASTRYYDDGFKQRRLYTAWDNLGQESIFFKGANRLVQAGVKPAHLMVYMLIGYKPTIGLPEPMEEILYRYNKLKEFGAKPYPMVYNNTDKHLKRFQKWVTMRFDEVCSWPEFERGERHEAPEEQAVLL